MIINEYNNVNDIAGADGGAIVCYSV